jgi:hypothetical protein
MLNTHVNCREGIYKGGGGGAKSASCMPAAAILLLSLLLLCRSGRPEVM